MCIIHRPSVTTSVNTPVSSTKPLSVSTAEERSHTVKPALTLSSPQAKVTSPTMKVLSSQLVSKHSPTSVAAVSVTQTGNQAVNQTANQSVNQMASQPVGQVASQSVGQVASQLVGQVASQSAGQVASQSVGQTAGQTKPVVSSTPQPSPQAVRAVTSPHVNPAINEDEETVPIELLAEIFSSDAAVVDW